MKKWSRKENGHIEKDVNRCRCCMHNNTLEMH